MAAPVSLGDPLGIPTEAIRADERDSGASGLRRAMADLTQTCLDAIADSAL
jgi:hypothetical protein